jgi:hypothetical protein
MSTQDRDHSPYRGFVAGVFSGVTKLAGWLTMAFSNDVYGGWLMSNS